MKKYIIVFLLVLVSLSGQRPERRDAVTDTTPEAVSSQESSILPRPRRLSYQGLLTKSNGQPAENKTYEVKFRLYKEADGGTHFWEEIHSDLSVEDGLISTILGKVSELSSVPSGAFLEIEIDGSILSPRQEFTSVFYSVLSDTASYAKGYTPTADLAAVALSGDYYDLNSLPDLGSIASQDMDNVDLDGGSIDGTTIGADSAAAAKFTDVDVSGAVTANVFVGSASGLTGILADSIGVLSGEYPFVFEGGTVDDYETTLFLEDPQEDHMITIPGTSGTIITTGNEESIDAVGTVGSGTWEGTAIADEYVSEDLTISGGTVDNTVIGGTTPAMGSFSNIISTGGVLAAGNLSLDGGTTAIGSSELNVLDGVTAGTVASDKALVVDNNKDIATLRNVTASGTISADTLTGSFIGDGSGITGVAASSVGVLSGMSPLEFEGVTPNEFTTTVLIEDPEMDAGITIPNVSGTFITTGNDGSIDAVGTVGSGTWQGTAVADTYVSDDLTISGGTVDSTVIGGSTPAAGTFTSVTST
ncbi:uncharacterized protein METZ01_LOCUS165906, partial [marine metagenome]